MGSAITVDYSGNAYVTGSTNSSNFPLVPIFPIGNPIQGSYGGGSNDAFVTKISADGSSIIYSTYLGGAGEDLGRGIALDADRNAYVVGQTDSSGNFPLQGALQETYGGGPHDAFITKVNTEGSSLLYSTYLGGNGEDRARGIDVDAGDNAYVAGTTSSTNFPTTLTPFQSANLGGEDVFIIKVNTAGTDLVYSTYLGGNGDDIGANLNVDVAGNVFVSGNTDSTNFPILGSYQGTNKGGEDVFITKVNAVGTNLLYSTYLGGSSNDYCVGMDVAPDGSAYVTGWTNSSIDFPLLNSVQGTYGGGSNDSFVSKMSTDGGTLVYSTYLGGSGIDSGIGIALDSLGNAYVTGQTDSTNFPTTPGSFQETDPFTGLDADAFVAKISDPPQRLNYFEVLVGDGGLFVDFDILPGFRSLLTGAQCIYSRRGLYQFDLSADLFTLWDTECRYAVIWNHDFGAVQETDYGSYILTLDFADGTQKVYHRTLENIEVTPVTNVNVTINNDGSADLTWSNTIAGQYYQVRVREDGSGREVCRANIGFSISFAHLTADQLACLQPGMTLAYRWLVRAYDNEWPFYNTFETTEINSTYMPANLVLTTDHSVYDWNGNLALSFDVRPGWRDHIDTVTVTGPATFYYFLDLILDWFDLSTDTRLNMKGWWKELEGEAISYGDYTFNIYFTDSYPAEAYTETLQNVLVTPIDSSTMNETILPDGAITFSWNLPTLTSQLYQVRLRSNDGSKEYYGSSQLSDGTSVTASSWDLRGLEHGRLYQWFVRVYDTGNNTMRESGRKSFRYDPFGIGEILFDKDADGYYSIDSDDTDCDDLDFAIHPGAAEICNGKDDNCNGSIDEGCTTYYQDSDSDGYGNPNVSQTATSQPAGYVTNNTDCNDMNFAINPDAMEMVAMEWMKIVTGLVTIPRWMQMVMV